jgi:hypothetical protein
VIGSVLVRGDRPVTAVAPFLTGMAIASDHDDHRLADSCRAGILIAYRLDRAGVVAEWQRLTGRPFPGDHRRR